MQKIMKRIAAFMLAAMMVASMSACNRQSEEERKLGDQLVRFLHQVEQQGQG